jgi:predicted dehydrogenase
MSALSRAVASRKPRIGYLGVGWIGRHRMAAIVEAGLTETAAVADVTDAAMAEAVALAPDAVACASLDELLAQNLDGIVIATPSALHARQAIAALEAGVAVFCQKPLGRDASETLAVISAAKAADRLLGVDLSYRRSRALEAVCDLVRSGALGRIQSVDLVFHNAYGPDKDWFYDPGLSGGGCVVDLGTHLIDLALWVLGDRPVTRVSSQLFHKGERITALDGVVEDHALATIELADGTVVRLACSWRLPVGADAEISATFHGTQGGARFANVGGSFYDFVAEHRRGTETVRLCDPPDAWGGRVAADWAARLAADERFDPAIEGVASVAAVIDRIYGRAIA